MVLLVAGVVLSGCAILGAGAVVGGGAAERVGSGVMVTVMGLGSVVPGTVEGDGLGGVRSIVLAVVIAGRPGGRLGSSGSELVLRAVRVVGSRVLMVTVGALNFVNVALAIVGVAILGIAVVGIAMLGIAMLGIAVVGIAVVALVMVGTAILGLGSINVIDIGGLLVKIVVAVTGLVCLVTIRGLGVGLIILGIIGWSVRGVVGVVTIGDRGTVLDRGSGGVAVIGWVGGGGRLRGVEVTVDGVPTVEILIVASKLRGRRVVGVVTVAATFLDELLVPVVARNLTILPWWPRVTMPPSRWGRVSLLSKTFLRPRMTAPPETPGRVLGVI